MLHIVTPLYRYELLSQVYDSIPKNLDITWHIAKTSQREKLDFPFIHEDARIRLYEVDCPDWDTATKRNVMFDNIKSGYFHLLDDDTTFYPLMYSIYQSNEAKKFEGMVIGAQINPSGSARVLPSYPESGKIDSGNVLCHHSVLESVRWEGGHNLGNDFVFWDKCWKLLGMDNTALIPNVVSVYNSLRSSQ